MNIEAHSIIEGLSGGVAASLVIGALSVSRNWARSLLLKFKILCSVRRFSVGASIQGATIGVSNRTGTSFIVRDLAVVTTKMTVRFIPAGEVTTCFDEPDQKISRHQQRLLKRGIIKSIEFPPVLALLSWNKPKTLEGFVEITPFTSHQFVLPNQLLQSVQGDLISLKLTVEYRSWSNEVKILSISSKELNHQLNNSIESSKKRLAPAPPLNTQQ